MREEYSRKIDLKLKALGIYQVSGGLIGFGMTIWAIAQMGASNALVFLIFLVAIALCIYSIYCGILLLIRNSNGLKHSLVNQYIQLINFSILGFGFKYISGVMLSIGFDLTNYFIITVDFRISTWWIEISTGSKVIAINFNIIAMLVIMFINKLNKRISQEKQETEILAIGTDFNT